MGQEFAASGVRGLRSGPSAPVDRRLDLGELSGEELLERGAALRPERLEITGEVGQGGQAHGVRGLGDRCGGASS